MSTQETNLKAIADAIRAKTGLTGTIKASEFASKIAAISTGVAKPMWVQTTLPFTRNWSSVCYGYDKFVAVNANSNATAYSFTGHDWIACTGNGLSAQWSSICYGGGKFVAVAKMFGTAIYSTDGITWSRATLPGSRSWTSICYGGDKFVAVCSNSILPAYSTDGINWTSARMPVSANWTSVCYGNGTFVAVASGSNIAAYSSDGINWTQTTLTDSANWSSVCFDYGYGNNVFNAFAPGKMNYGIRGESWSSSWIPSDYNVTSSCHNGGKLVAVADNSNVARYDIYSGSLSNSSILPVSANWTSVCYGNGTFVAVASGSNIAAYLDDRFNYWA